LRTPDEKPALLIVEDDEAALRQLRWTFIAYDVHGVRSREEAVDACRRQAFPVVLLDLGLPGDPDGSSEGLTALGEILAVQPAAKVIVDRSSTDEIRSMPLRCML
jgi:two-component system NtrC family response regulator